MTLSTATQIGTTVELNTDFDSALARVTAALKTEGFGVLTEIDVRATLREKLGVEFRDYVIIGACNPPLAHRALQADLGAGTLLPCNVVVYEENGASVVAMFDPEVGMAMMGVPALQPIAAEAKARLVRALERV